MKHDVEGLKLKKKKREKKKRKNRVPEPARRKEIG
jgi:hypothetical protein